MKTEVKKIDSIKREMTVEVSGDIVKNKFDDVFKRIGKDAKVAGFRAGHVPRDVLEKHYAEYAHEQVLRELIPELYQQAIEKEGIQAVELPEISDVRLDRTMLSFKAGMEVSPEIKIKAYKGIPIDYAAVVVSSDEVKRNIDSLKEMRKRDVVDESFARSLGFPNVEALEKSVERQMLAHKENVQRQKAEQAIIEKLLADTDFPLPRSLVNRQLQELIRQVKLDMALKGVPKDKIEEEEKGMPEKLEGDAKRQVKLYLIFSEIAKKEQLPQDDQVSRHVMEFLLQQAEWKVTA
jgi:FKBP-type peptidyl-prolyl cis-trans isomerase (trigger factor)